LSLSVKQCITPPPHLPNFLTQNDIGKKLGEMLDYKKAHKPVKLDRSRVASRAAALLFKELVASMDADYNQT